VFVHRDVTCLRHDVTCANSRPTLEMGLYLSPPRTFHIDRQHACQHACNPPSHMHSCSTRTVGSVQSSSIVTGTTAVPVLTVLTWLVSHRAVMLRPPPSSATTSVSNAIPTVQCHPNRPMPAQPAPAYAIPTVQCHPNRRMPSQPSHHDIGSVLHR
jgi:hypothetical protein